MKIEINAEVISVTLVANVKTENGMLKTEIATIPYSKFEELFCYDDTPRKTFKEKMDEKMK